MNLRKILIIALCLSMLTGFSAVKAQTTTGSSYSGVITWVSSSYVPSDFPGKAAPTNGSTISLSLLLLNNSKVIDLSSYPIMWYLDGGFLNGGVGQYQTNFKVTQTAGGSHFVSATVQLPDQSTVSTSVNIPVTRYRAVVDAPYPNSSIQNNSIVNLSLIPYFFNVSSFKDLLFSWNINNAQQTSNSSDNALSLSVSNQQSGQNITVNGSVQNSSNPYEFSSAQMNLYVQ